MTEISEMDVAVVIPCYNHATTLARAIYSAQNQSGVGQIIIVDDASTDKSLTVAQCLSAHDSRILYIQNDLNVGPGLSRNIGVEHASCPYITFLDADDELLGGFVAEALNCFRANSVLWVVKSKMIFYDPVKGYILPECDPRYLPVVLSSACGMVIDRRAFAAIGGFPSSNVFRGPAGGEDVALMQAVVKCLQPLGKLEMDGYKVWSRSGSHVDQFLANTRLNGKNGFDFIELTMDQQPGSQLSRAVQEHAEKAFHKSRMLFPLKDVV